MYQKLGSKSWQVSVPIVCLFFSFNQVFACIKFFLYKGISISTITDYWVFYLGSVLFATSQNQIYSHSHQIKTYNEISSIICESYVCLPFSTYVYPPILNLILLPMGYLSFEQSFYFFIILSLILIIISLIYLANYLSLKFYTTISIFFFLLSYRVFSVDTLLGGQVSFIGFALCSASLLFFSNGRHFLNGLISPLLLYKPPLFAFYIICLFITSGKKYIKGFIIGIILIYFSSAYFIGLDWPINYLNLSSSYQYGDTYLASVKFFPKRGIGFFQQYYLLFADNSIFKWMSYLFTSVPLWIFIILKLREANYKKENNYNENLIFLLCISLIISVITSIHAISYDLIVIFPSLIIIYFKFLKDEYKKEFIYLAIFSYWSMMLPDPIIFYDSILVHLMIIAMWLLLCLRWYGKKMTSQVLFDYKY